MVVIDPVQLISNVGFPIAMVVYLLLRFEKRLDENTKSNDKLHDAIQAEMTLTNRLLDRLSRSG